MKTLKKGTPTPWSKKVTCTGAGNNKEGCKSLLLIEKSDLYTTIHSCWRDDDKTCYTFKCGECGAETDISNLPESVKQDCISKAAFFRRKAKKEREEKLK